MLHLALRSARHRIAALLAVACAILGAAALLTGTGVLAETGLRSSLPAGRLAGADVLVAADQSVRAPGDMTLALTERGTVPATLVDRLAGLPGVKGAATDLSFPAAAVTTDGGFATAADPATAGHGWSSVRLLAHPHITGEAPAGHHEVALDRATATAARAAVGDRVRIVAAGRPAVDYRVSAIVDAPGAGLLFADSAATGLAGRTSGPRAGTVDLIGLRAAPGHTDEVAAAVRDRLAHSGATARHLKVLTGSDRGDAVSPGDGAARSLLVLLSSSLAGVVVLITGFVVAGALTVAVNGQRRDLALMRAVGATPKQIRRLAAAQAMVVAAVAYVPGAALGYVLAGQLRQLLVDRGAVPAALPLTVSPLPALATALLLAGAVQLAARGAAWRTSTRPATEAVAESRTEPREPARMRTYGGLLVIVAATTLSVAPLLSRTPIGAAATQMAGIVGAIGLAMAGPALTRWAGGALGRRLRPGTAAPTWLAVANVRGYALRVAGVVSTLAMAVAFVLTYTLTLTTVAEATAQDTRTGTLAEHRITAPGLGGLPTGLLEDVRRTPGVKAVAPVGSTDVVYSYRELGDVTTESASALILTPDAPRVLDLGVRSGSLTRLRGATVALSEETARSLDAEVGDRIELTLGDGTEVRPRVVAVYTRGLGFGPFALSHDLAVPHTTTGLDQSALVRTDGTPAAAHALAALAAKTPGVSVGDTADESDGGLSDAPAEVWINLATIAVLLAYLLLSIANKLVATTSQRREELATLRLNGTTPAQIRAMMRREAVLITAGALVAGMALTVVPLALLGTAFLHHPWPSGPIWLVPATAVTIATVAYLSLQLPTRHALRTPPAATLGARG
ncbi:MULTISPECIES: ABC transporter permease [unclassified Streptomyces]|uniref:ABC transporter permease n=1 Tax=unclassified Streptomyces TaxID=2593676 RepID=UPI0004BD66C8|nr:MULTISPECIES: ABC transporter permease [unclassified Streptomyces]